MTETVEVVVIGAGVVGLAVGRALALSGRDVVVVEAHDRIGQETSSRNSGVIHSGIYYPAGSLKAQLCTRGRDLLYEYCAERGIAHRRMGKIIVAQEHQITALQLLREKGTANGVLDLQWLAALDVRALEPLLQCAAALFSPSTGIVDVHEYLMALWADLESKNGVVALRSELLSISPTVGGLAATVRSGTTTTRFGCRWVINCAGLRAVELLTKIDGYPTTLPRKSYFAKGNYFAYTAGKPFRHLVYPLPTESGLGIHVTLDLDGSARFGPDVEWVDSCDYSVDPRRADMFYESIVQYWPTIPAGSLQPAYAGIRPKLVGAGAAAADFIVEGQSTHSIPGLINLLGIESPGLTSSLAIADHVLSMVSMGG